MCALYPNWDPYGTAVYHEPVRRSWLVVPVLDEDTLGRLDSIAPDVVVLDLEDSIHDTKKPAARERFQEAMEAAAISGAEVFVRPDIGLLYADLKAAIWPGLTGVVLPKVSSVEEVVRAEEAMRRIETERGLPEVLELQLCIETAAGNRHADKIIRAAKKIRSVSLGRADLVMDLRPDPLGEIHMMPYLAQRMVLLARAHGIAPIGAWWDGQSRGMLASPQATLKAAERGRRIGFTGALCVDPVQVGSLERGFTPSEDEVAWAESAAGRSEAASGSLTPGEGSAGPSGMATAGLSGMAATAKHILTYAQQCQERDATKGRMG